MLHNQVYVNQFVTNDNLDSFQEKLNELEGDALLDPCILLEIQLSQKPQFLERYFEFLIQKVSDRTLDSEKVLNALEMAHLKNYISKEAFSKMKKAVEEQGLFYIKGYDRDKNEAKEANAFCLELISLTHNYARTGRNQDLKKIERVLHEMYKRDLFQLMDKERFIKNFFAMMESSHSQTNCRIYFIFARVVDAGAKENRKNIPFLNSYFLTHVIDIKIPLNSFKSFLRKMVVFKERNQFEDMVMSAPIMRKLIGNPEYLKVYRGIIQESYRSNELPRNLFFKINRVINQEEQRMREAKLTRASQYNHGLIIGPTGEVSYPSRSDTTAIMRGIDFSGLEQESKVKEQPFVTTLRLVEPRQPAQLSHLDTGKTWRREKQNVEHETEQHVEKAQPVYKILKRGQQ